MPIGPRPDHDTVKLNQKDRLLRINTVLDAVEKGIFPGDPLLLIKMEGEEGISKPFYYDVTMYRSTEKNIRRPIEPKMLINTPVTFSFRGENPKCPFRDRTGVFETFEQVDSGFPGEYLRFCGRIVPRFKMLDYEVVFRIFENESVLDIIKQVLEVGPTLDPKFLDFTAVDDEQRADPNAFPVLEYCAQFGESTFNFVSRLMRQYGIWYFFATDKQAPERLAENDTMIFKRTHPGLTGCYFPRDSDGPNEPYQLMTLTADPPIFSPGEASHTLRTISAFQRVYRPTFAHFKVGNFNPLDPTSPFGSTQDIKPQFDVLSEAGGETTRFRHEIFPVPCVANDQSDRGASGAAKRFEDAKGYNDNRRVESESTVFAAAGVSKNPFFIAGRTFTIEFDLTNRGEDGKSFLMQMVKMSAFDTHYDHLTSDAVLRDVLNNFFGQQSVLDVTLLDVSQGMNNWLKTKINPSASSSDFLNYFSSGFIANATTLIPGVVKNLTELLDKTSHSGFSNSFAAIPGEIPPKQGDGLLTTRPPEGFPLPEATKPRAYGPHLGWVIGPEKPGPNAEESELDTSDQDIFADALGRVRVRFPWDRKDGFPFHQPQIDPRPGCWVRVSEGWAGGRVGMQFLPRIGDEVIVDFIDGDPDRPIITGRVYNARPKGRTNLPFPDPRVDNTPLETPDDYVNLPSTAPTGAQFQRSGIKTRSTPLSKTAKDRYHLLRFDDTRDKEQYLIRSQRRLDITALEKRYESIGSDRHLTVGGKQPPPPGPPAIAGTYFAKVFQHYHLHVGDPDFPADSGNRITLIEQNDEIKIVKNSGQSIGGNWSADVGGQATINAIGPAGTIVLNAALNITLMVGASSIVITPAGISITAPVINLVAPAILSTVPVVPMGAAPLPPGIPIPPEVQKPTDPTAADPGDTLTPPE